MTSPVAVPTSTPAALHLKQTLDSISQSIDPDDLSDPLAAFEPAIDVLNSILDVEDNDTVSHDALEVIHGFISDPSANQMVVGELAMVLPKVVVKFAALSSRCKEDVARIFDCLLRVCNPRDLLTAFCEALDSQLGESTEPVCFVPLLSGLKNVFHLIQRRHLEQLKVALPVILKILHAVVLEFDDGGNDYLFELFSATLSIGACIQQISEKMVDRNKDELFALLGLYVLENIALFSRVRDAQLISSCEQLLLESYRILKICGFSLLGLITGTDVDTALGKVSKVNGDNISSSFLYPKHGAALAVLWGYINDEISKAAGEQLNIVINNIKKNRVSRWQAFGMLRFILFDDYPWELKRHTIDLVFNIFDSCTVEDHSDSDFDFSSFIITFFSSIQAVQQIMIRASDGSLRKKAFATLRKVIFDLPSAQRFDMIEALITNSSSPSMSAILIDLVRNEVLDESNQRSLPVEPEIKGPSSAFWTQHALRLVEFILKPPNSGPPSLPEQSDSVSSALNLLRLILLLELKENTHGSGVLNEDTLRKIYSEWLLPLRTLVSMIRAEAEREMHDISDAILCSLNPVEFVLYSCIELIEEKLKYSK